LGGDDHYARDYCTEDGEDRLFTSGSGLEWMRGEVLHQVGVHLKAVPGLGEDFCKKGKRG